MRLKIFDNVLRLNLLCKLYWVHWVVGLLVVFNLGVSWTAQAEEPICCTRGFAFVPIKMPPEQEYDYSGFINTSFTDGLNWLGMIDCPLICEHFSLEAYQGLQKYIEAVGELSGAPSDSQAQKALKEYLDFEYIWKGTLRLQNIDYIEPGYWEEGYEGEPDYTGGNAFGHWSFIIELINVHFGEQVEQGSVSWSGGLRDGLPLIEELASSKFNPLDDLVWDYERIPFTADLKPTRDPIPAGERMIIHVRDVKDDQGRPAKPWQRVAVRVEHGEILNGEYNEEEDHYVFEVGSGAQIQYKAPEICEIKREKIEIYNSCWWGQKWLRPLYATGRREKIGQVQFDIKPLRDWNAQITYQSIMDVHDAETTAERQLLVKIEARLKPYRKMQPGIPAGARQPALEMAEKTREKMESGAYDKFLDPATRAELEKALKELQQLAVDVGGIDNYASRGAMVTLIDVFDRTDTHEWATEKWHWSIQYNAQMPLNIGLTTRVPDGDYLVDIGTRDPDWAEQDKVPVSYQYRASKISYPPDLKEDFNCSGRGTVDLVAGELNLFVDIPEQKMIFTGKEKVLGGMHGWTDYGGGKVRPAIELFGSDPKCSGALSGTGAAALLLDSRESLKWRFERVCK